MAKEKKVKGGYVSVKSNKLAYLFALLPVALSLLYILMLGIDGEWSLGPIKVFSPISSFSLFTLLILALAFGIWAFAGYMCAKAKLTIIKSILVCHIFPILSTIIYFVLFVINIETETNIQDIMYIFGGCGCNFFGIVGTFLYSLIAINVIEPIVDIVIMIAAFIVGYVIYTNKNDPKKQQNDVKEVTKEE